MTGEESEPVTVGAIPFCHVHDTDWQEGCDGCAWGQDVQAMHAEHLALYPECPSWPLSGCASAEPLEAWIGDERLVLPGDEPEER